MQTNHSTQEADQPYRFSHVPFVKEAVITQGFISWEADVADLCLKGILIHDETQIDLDSTQSVNIDIHFSQADTLSLSALPNHRDNGYFGFRFIDADDSDPMCHLHNYLATHLSERSISSQELSALFEAH